MSKIIKTKKQSHEYHKVDIIHTFETRFKFFHQLREEFQKTDIKEHLIVQEVN